MHTHTRGIDIADLEIQHFAEAQAHRVNGQDVGLRAIDEAGYLLLGEDVGPGFDPGWLDDVDPLPLLVEHMLVEELQSVAVELDGAPGVGLDQGLEIRLEIIAGQSVGTSKCSVIRRTAWE